MGRFDLLKEIMSIQSITGETYFNTDYLIDKILKIDKKSIRKSKIEKIYEK